jgi:hypothetical protein
VDESGGSLAHFTTVDGVWTTAGGIISCTNAADSHLAYNTALTDVPWWIIACDVRLNSTGANPSLARAGPMFRTNGGGNGNPVGQLFYNNGTPRARLEYDAVSGTVFANVTASLDTWYPLMVVGYPDNTVALFFNGLRAVNGSFSNGFQLGFSSHNCAADFRNLKAWIATLPPAGVVGGGSAQSDLLNWLIAR